MADDADAADEELSELARAESPSSAIDLELDEGTEAADVAAAPARSAQTRAGSGVRRALVIALVRSALFRRFATYGPGKHGEALALFARRITLPLLLAFPAAVLATGSWRDALTGGPRNADLWIGAIAYLLALLELEREPVRPRHLAVEDLQIIDGQQ